MKDIEPGMPVIITDASGDDHVAVALSAVEIAGHTFPVVWVEHGRGESATRIPWPANAVRKAES